MVDTYTLTAPEDITTGDHVSLLVGREVRGAGYSGPRQRGVVTATSGSGLTIDLEDGERTQLTTALARKRWIKVRA